MPKQSQTLCKYNTHTPSAAVTGSQNCCTQGTSIAHKTDMNALVRPRRYVALCQQSEGHRSASRHAPLCTTNAHTQAAAPNHKAQMAKGCCTAQMRKGTSAAQPPNQTHMMQGPQAAQVCQIVLQNRATKAVNKGATKVMTTKVLTVAQFSWH